jgi:hypothetical protein
MIEEHRKDALLLKLYSDAADAGATALCRLIGKPRPGCLSPTAYEREHFANNRIVLIESTQLLNASPETDHLNAVGCYFFATDLPTRALPQINLHYEQ